MAVNREPTEHFRGQLMNLCWSTPISISKLTSRNRIAFPPISGNWAAPDGSVTEKIVEFYHRIAAGGCGMVVVGSVSVSNAGKGSSRALVFCNRDQLPGYAQIASAITEEGAIPVLQIMHVGGQGNPEFTDCESVSPSGGFCKATGHSSRPLTADEIADVQQQFLATAQLAAEAGFMAIELHLAHGYLLHEFLSPHANTRNDRYGGSMANRLRLVCDILNDIRRELPELIVGARISAEDYLADGLSLAKNRLLLPLLENAGVSYFSVTAGTYETSANKHAAMADGEFMRYAREVKKNVSVPVIGVGKILTVSEAEQNLLADNCDLVAMGRALVADPDTVKKSISGKVQNLCSECDRCRYLRYGLPCLKCPVSGVGR